MRVIAALTSPHQDAIIERILRARGEWAPPWERERRARGPPPHPRQLEFVFGDPHTPGLGGDSQLPPFEGEDFSQARPGGPEEVNQERPVRDEGI